MAQSESFGFCTEAVKTKLSELSTEGGTFKTSQTTKTVCQEKIKRESLRSKCAAALRFARFSVFTAALPITCVMCRGAFADQQPYGTFYSRRGRTLRSRNRQTERNTTKGSPSGGEGRAHSVADRHVAKATRRGRDAAGGSRERRKKMEGGGGGRRVENQAS